MMWARFEVRHAILFELGLEAANAAPVGVLATIVGEHLLGRLELADRHAIDFDHRRRRGTAEQVRAHDEPRVIIHEGDEVGVTPSKTEREDIRLPHLIGRGSLKEPGPNHVPLPGRGAFGHQVRRVQPLAHRLRAGRQKKAPAQYLRDAFDAERGVFLFELDDLVGDRCRQPGLPGTRRSRLQPRLTQGVILADPAAQAALRHANLGADIRQTEALLQPQAHGLELFISGETAHFFRAASPPRGAVPLLLYYSLFIHVNTPSIIGVSTN